jgi:hypothetical protein
VIVRKGRAKNFSFTHRIYSGQELRWLFEQVGFVDVRIYGSFRGDSYGRDATRLIVVGRKTS